MIDIDTTINLKWNDGTQKRQERIILPYQLNILPLDNYDEDDNLVRICIGTLDTKEDINPLLAKISSVLVRHEDCKMGMFQEIELKSGVATLSLKNPVVTEKRNTYGRFFDIEAEEYTCNLTNTR